MSFAKELQEKLGEHNPEEIEELILDGLFKVEGHHLTHNHKEDLEKYEKLIHLTMNGIGLKNLTNFPKLPQLSILELSNNELTGKDLHHLVNLYPSLYKVKLNGNKIESIDEFKQLKDSSIKKISVSDNPFIASNSDYREKLFEMIPSLTSIDGKDKEGKDVVSTEYGDEEDFEEGEFEENEGEEFEDGEEFDEEDEDDEDGEDDDDDEDKKPNKKQKHK